MKKKIASLASIAVLALGVSFFAAPSVSQAVIIHNVTVTISGPGGGGDTFALWTFGATGINLNLNDTLVLAQTSGFNFDTSDVPCLSAAGGSSVANCNSAVVHVTTTGPIQNFTDSTNVLTVKHADPLSPSFNEAQTYTALGFSSGFDYSVSVGYADNLHTDACGSHIGVAGVNGSATCFPEIFNGAGGSTVATVFQGAGTTNSLGVTSAGHCPVAGSLCWDSGAILIRATAVPEPASLLLLGSGLVGFAAWRGRKLKRNA